MASDQQSGHRPPEQLGDRYRVVSELGSGATAITWRGWDERLERPVAIKILRRHHAQDAVFVRRFQREARAAASVSHGNVVDIYDVGQERDDLYIVMQLVEGEDLKALIQREAPLQPQRVDAIIGHVLDGLHAIHAAGIIHRDIKPQNILIGRDEVARVTDFGIAHADEDAGMTTAGTAVGTAAYMAPEQAQARPVNEATDLYAVGVILYELLTGFLPFNAPTAMAMMLEHIQAAPVPPSQRRAGHGISPAMDGVVLRALSKYPEERFATAREMKAAVAAALQGGPGAQATVVTPSVQATRQGATPLVRRNSPRRTSAVPVSPAPQAEGTGLGGAVAGLLLVMLLAVAGFAAWYAWGLWDDAQQDAGTTTPTVSAPAVEPTADPTDEPALIQPTATAASTQVIEQIDPPDPTTAPPTPTPEPAPTEPPPTDIISPTLTPVPEPTEGPVLIEPIDGTPFSPPGT